jgi:hypothetical protein
MQSKVVQSEVKSEINWDDAICEARMQISKARKEIRKGYGRIRELKKAIESFERLRDKGFPFPSEEERSAV